MPAGRPKHTKTPETLQKVRNWAMVGVTHENIATLIGIAPKTLLKHYRTELDVGKATANATVCAHLFDLARKGNLGAICFWLKTQAGWRETSLVQTQQLNGQ